MARKTSSRKSRPSVMDRIAAPVLWARVWVVRVFLIVVVIVCGTILAHRWFAPPDTLYMKQEAFRLGEIRHRWVPLGDVAPVMARSLVAAEDANFCLHWGFDMNAIRDALEDGSGRGASTLSQQVVKNVYLWHGRSWTRKALEAGLTPVVELFWSKRRIIEVYLNVAEFDEGIFGIDAAARHYFDVAPDALSDVQAARLAAVLPNPKDRSASRPGDATRRRAAGIMDGAATIRRDGRAACFED
ncbi:monofunctional biosynthetic peptidoglycan transglycosylase [Roseovarius atlanticus]|uniref:monofunctional biosynthetic peptidoglycan transglycosylase n=2 Tax=Roseovarius atlanticus TaxID=1641875 RepID=UPI001C980467|nr:monofunctional biosynthetic peptidoglycan transglycosylase [Roseovarius atlanticus]MBY5987229.1 monofunctional biosynthetic peptidoglycan transglycosylase [Roseovarius atlanticus]MBY6125869.1 monofunctional biosynthetic peptidoglycan transglycosylase [Roseovarius atlanticus]MBY6149670.1 monofunctional biosynthetic peptidoglycan transglycosylase [Roseovarius atlanticus]